MIRDGLILQGKKWTRCGFMIMRLCMNRVFQHNRKTKIMVQNYITKQPLVLQSAFCGGTSARHSPWRLQ